VSGPEALRGRRLRFELWELLLVGIGAIPGALLRWQATLRLGPLLGPGLGAAVDGPAAANLVVNLLGAFLLGVLAGPIPWRTPLVLLLGIGFCGSLTTFSSWMLDLILLWRAGQGVTALALAALSLALGLAAAAAGQGLCRRLRRSGPLRSRR